MLLLLASIPTCCLARHHKTHYPLDAICTAMRRFPHYPLNAHYHCEKTPSPSAECSLYHREKIPSLSTECLPYNHERIPSQPLLTHCVSMRRVPVGRLTMNLLNAGFIALSHFSILPYSSRKCCLYVSFAHLRRSLWSVPLIWRHSSGSDIRGLPGCIVLGIAASHYSMLKCSWAHTLSCLFYVVLFSQYWTCWYNVISYLIKLLI
jgi:hypothetical protein